MSSLEQFSAQIRTAWGKLGPRLRVAVIGTLVAAAIAVLWVGVIARPNYRVLFSGLDPKDAASVVSALDGAKIDYQLTAGGSVVEVPDRDVDRARLMLAEQDLPKTGNVGFELFEQQSFGLTDFAQKVNYRRALQGELERTISQVDAVAGARVHITQPEKAVFADEKIAPTASVTVTLVRGRELSERQVGAVRHLVASAVEGLEPGGVTIVDTRGALLSRAGLGDDTADAALDYETRFERDLEQRLTRLLERTIGVAGAEVRVAADHDFSKVDTTEEVYDPEQTAVRSESMQEVLEGTGADRPGGVAGAPANEPGAAAATANGSRGGSSNVTRSKNYEINRTVVRTVGPGATLKRLTVAVLVDGTYTPAEDGSEPVFTARSEAELAGLRSVVESAIGFNPARGDRIEIASVPFHDRPNTDIGPIADAPLLQQYLPYLIGGGLLSVLGIGWLVTRRKRGKTVVQAELLSLPTTVSAAQAALSEPGGSAPVQAALPAAQDAPPANAEILALATSDPERTADVIRSWIAAEQT